MSHPNNAVDDDDDEMDLYAVLKIDRSASFDTIQRSFKRLSRNFHPDKRRSSDDKESAEDFFVAIKLAHDILSDPVLRLAYDHGGLVAVDIIRRSHLSASQQQGDEHGSGGQQQQRQNDQFDDEGNQNLYLKLQNTKSKDEAIKLIHEIVEGYTIQRSIMQNAPIGVEAELVHIYDPKMNNLHSRGLGSLRVQAQRTFFLSKHMEMSVTGQTQLQRRPQQQGIGAARTTSLGLSYRTDSASHHFLNCNLNQSNPKQSQLSFQTSRRFAAGNMFSLGLGGSIQTMPSSWVYSISTNRIIMLGSIFPRLRSTENARGSANQKQEQQTSNHQSNHEATKLHVSWSLGMTLLGKIQSIAGTMRNLTYPQYKFRLGLLESPPLKLTFDSAEEESWHAALSVDWNWWRVKVTKVQALGTTGNWTLRYGLKYDIRGAKMGRSWSVLLHLESSDDWHLRVPIIIQQIRVDSWEWPVTCTILVLSYQWLQDNIRDWWWPYLTNSSSIWRRMAPARGSHFAPAGRTRLDDNNPAFPQYTREVINSIAAKKRLFESKRNGLVLIKAVWCNGDSSRGDRRSRLEPDEDVTHALQFWVVDSRLNLPIQQSRWWLSPKSLIENPTNHSPFLDWFENLRVLASQWGTHLLNAVGRNTTINYQTQSAVGTSSDRSLQDTASLYVRYQLDNSVYEIRFYEGEDEMIILPTSRATKMGLVGQVY
ncbi:hypothetical protein ACA910_022285 [Epithemia clementina (nom. ined.)]